MARYWAFMNQLGALVARHEAIVVRQWVPNGPIVGSVWSDRGAVQLRYVLTNGVLVA